jgi:hypothetical protein
MSKTRRSAAAEECLAGIEPALPGLLAASELRIPILLQPRAFRPPQKVDVCSDFLTRYPTRETLSAFSPTGISRGPPGVATPGFFLFWRLSSTAASSLSTA